jgi:hypothetical protein
MATAPRRLNVAGAVSGVAIAAAMLLWPVVFALRFAESYAPLDRLGMVLSMSVLWAIWVGVVVRTVLNVRRITHGLAPVGTAGIIWLATIIASVAGTSLAATVASAATVSAVPATQSAASVTHTVPWWPIGGAGSIPLALVARRRRDVMVQNRLELAETEIDATIVQLRHDDEASLEGLRALIDDRSSGVLVIDEFTVAAAAPAANRDAIVAVLLATDGPAALIAFARAGEELPLGDDAAALIERSAVVLGSRGRCRVVTTPPDALRALALRTTFNDVIVYLGAGSDLDDEVRRRCVTIGAGPQRSGDQFTLHGRTWRFSSGGASSSNSLAVMPQLALRFDVTDTSVRVRLLRSDPLVDGLNEPFTAPLRRKSVEMVAYLALHDREPITGDRLRARVLGRDGDASARTLANVASAVRRSLGDDDTGPRLRPVSSAGLYQLRGVDCDLTEFHRLIAAARDALAINVLDTLRRALSLVEGEPLAAVLRGYEWFIPEGHLARLQRDGEWAALRLAAEARQVNDVDLAFWAIERGRLLDPYSDALEAALHRVPRLREFGGDTRGRAQNESVSAG